MRRGSAYNQHDTLHLMADDLQRMESTFVMSTETLSLLLSATESYKRLFQALALHRSYSIVFEGVIAMFDTQKALYINEVTLMLLAVTECPQDIEDLLREPDHPLRQSHALNGALENGLGISFERCRSLLCSINGTLTDIIRDPKWSIALVGYTDTRKKPLISRILARPTKRIRWDGLDKYIDRLRQYNEGIHDIMAGVSKNPREPTIRPLSAQSRHRSAAQFTHIRRASLQVHEDISSSWSCESRNIKSLKTCIRLQVKDFSREDISTVRFRLVVIALNEADVPVDEPVFLVVEALVQGIRNMSEPLESGNNLYRRDNTEEISSEKLRLIRGPHDIDSLSSSCGDVTRSTLSSSLSSVEDTRSMSPSSCLESTELPNGLETKNINFWSNGHQPTSNAAKHSLRIGFLHQTPGSSGTVYYSSDDSRLLPTCDLVSLTDALIQARDAGSVIPVKDKLQLAKILAMSVLRFHSTPWLNDRWSSSDIYVSKKEISKKESYFSEPCLDVRLSMGMASYKISEPSKKNPRSITVARNEVIFSLGVVLLEIGFGTPIREMQQAEDSEQGNIEHDYYSTAQRLGRLVSKTLGGRYGKVVRSCLACDFGVENDLQSENLQGAFYFNVVDELNRCLKAARDC